MTDPYDTRRGKIIMTVVVTLLGLFMLWGFLNSLGFELR